MEADLEFKTQADCGSRNRCVPEWISDDPQYDYVTAVGSEEGNKTRGNGDFLH